MKKGFYPRLALDGMRKNRKLYLPYLISCIGMVMMEYILQALSFSPLVLEIRHGSNIRSVLNLGKYVVAVFALLFLLYTNAFLVKRRYKEFGLYSILGMNRRNIGRVILWESVISAGIGLTGGILLGILLSKLAELGLLNLVGSEIDYRFTVPFEAIKMTVLLFGAIFIILTLKSLIKVARSKPLELLKSENYGEKPIKANWIFAVIGIIILAVAYYLAVSIKSPLTAVMVFFIAVIMVIVATYLLFMSGSVAVCKVLQKNKKYYYKKQHFVSVSNMAYRMKRNGAGLASICILATMVLVMISSTSSLYFGKENAIKSLYPRDIELSVELWKTDNLTDDKISVIRDEYSKVFEDNGFSPENVYEYRYASIAGMLKGDRCEPDSGWNEINLNYDNMRMLYFVSVEDYNKIMDTDYSLSDGEAMVCPLRCDYKLDTLTVGNVKLNIVGVLDGFISISESSSILVPSLMLVIPDYDTVYPLESLKDNLGYPMLSVQYYYGYDCDLDDDATIELYRKNVECLDNIELIKNDGSYSYSTACAAEEIGDFTTTYGGLFFIGIILSVIFIFAAAVIIYYKQISEGYEDSKRFEIMRNVGMTKDDIKKTINSQVLTVFFAPLLLAGLHLCFAFPFIWKILQLFHLVNLKFVILVTTIAFILFAAFYAVIYKITAKAYYSIVSSKQN